MARGDEEVEYESIDDCEVVEEREKAVLVRFTDAEGDERKVWVPKSVISEDSEVQGGEDNGELIVEKWFAKKEDLT